MNPLARIALGLAALVSTPLADVLTVGPARSGAQFTEIQAAIDAARDDDVILVRPGTYASFRLLKPLRILGDGTGTVSVRWNGRSPLPWTLVRDISAGAEVVLSGLSFSSYPGLALLSVLSSPGTVVLHDLDLTAIDGAALSVAGASSWPTAGCPAEHAAARRTSRAASSPPGPSR